MKGSVYHILLRTSALTLAFVLLFMSGILSPITRELSRDTGLYLATAIGMSAAVMPTEINTLSAELAKRDNELTQREIAVNLKEATASNGDISTFILSVLLFILLVLIILNYILDYIRNRKSISEQKQYEQAA